jgi:hypothetical protein
VDAGVLVIQAQVQVLDESGTNRGRRLRLDATGAESDGSVRILGGRTLS